MRKIKKYLIVLLLALVLVLSACNKTDDPEDTPLELDTRYTDALVLETSFEGKEFIANGIGEVTLGLCVDGDTVTVRSGSTNITIRFLGINTPESTGKVEPWGKPASTFTKEKLTSANSIVLEAEGERTDNNGRYLAWVWYQAEAGDQYRLLNLEIIEEAYSFFTMGSTKYHETFISAHYKNTSIKKRLYGETDPSFSTSKVALDSTIAYVLSGQEEYLTGTVFDLTVQVIRTVGDDFFVRDVLPTDIDGEVVYGDIFVFGFYGVSYYTYLNIGDIVTFKCKFDINGNYGDQITDIQELRITGSEEVVLDVIDSSEITDLSVYKGEVITIDNLIYKGFYQSQNDQESNPEQYTLNFESSTGKEFDVRIGNRLISRYNVNDLVVDEVYMVTGGVSYYEFASDSYQLMLGDKNKSNDIVLK